MVRVTRSSDTGVTVTCHSDNRAKIAPFQYTGLIIHRYVRSLTVNGGV